MRPALKRSLPAASMAAFMLMGFTAAHAQTAQSMASPMFLPQSSGYQEKYVASVLGQFRRIAGDDQVIDSKDVRLQGLIQDASRRAMVISQFVGLDLDDDGFVSLSEMKASSRTGRQSIPEKKFSSSDLNGDGQISLGEWKETMPLGNYSRTSGRDDGSMIGQFIAIDPNGDGSLTVSEMTEVAIRNFTKYDLDGNGELSNEETASWHKSAAEAQRAERMERTETRPGKRPWDRDVRRYQGGSSF